MEVLYERTGPLYCYDYQTWVNCTCVGFRNCQSGMWSPIVVDVTCGSLRSPTTAKPTWSEREPSRARQLAS